MAAPSERRSTRTPGQVSSSLAISSTSAVTRLMRRSYTHSAKRSRALVCSRRSGAAARDSESAAVDLHVGMIEVGVGLRAQSWDVLAVVGAREALDVPNHVPDRDVVATAQPPHQAQTRGHLCCVVEHFLVAVTHVLD